MIILVAALALGYVPTFIFVLRHLKDRDALERDERARNAREQDTIANRHAAQVETLVLQIREAHSSRADEIQTLLQRIQAPEIAVIQHQVETAGPDEEYPLSDAATAEIQERQLALERIERLEREGVLAG